MREFPDTNVIRDKLGCPDFLIVMLGRRLSSRHWMFTSSAVNYQKDEHVRDNILIFYIRTIFLNFHEL